MLRTSLQFAALEKLKGGDTEAVWDKSDLLLGQMEGAVEVGRARNAFQERTKAGLLKLHATLFSGRKGAGQLRETIIKPLYRGQDCPEPQFLDRSLHNWFTWLTAESVAEIHPIEKAALVICRTVDIWPFEFGNLTVGI